MEAFAAQFLVGKTAKGWSLYQHNLNSSAEDIELLFLDDTAMLVIVAPLYVPLVGALGFDLVWYGVLYTITCQIAYMTPPFGYNLFLMRAMAPPEIGIRDIYSSITPFVLVMVLALALVMVFPEIALWLPNYIYEK